MALGEKQPLLTIDFNGALKPTPAEDCIYGSPSERRLMDVTIYINQVW